MNDPYSVLGVDRNASESEIKSAYKKLVKKYHPDRYTDPDMAELANEKMSEINTAYDRIMEDRKNGVRYDSYSSGQSGSRNGGYSQNGSRGSTSGGGWQTYGGGYNTAGYGTTNRNTSFDAYRIRQMLGSGDINGADNILTGVPLNQRNAEWNYLKGMVSYQRGWFNEAYHYTQQATMMEPGNQEYSSAFQQMNRQRSGYMTGNAFQRNSPTVRSDDICDILNGLCIADCCCEMMGGDLISCC